METLRAVDEWAEGKSPLVTAFALSLLPYVELADQWLDVIASGEATEYLGPIPPLREWRSFYTEENNAIASVVETYLPRYDSRVSNVVFLNRILEVISGMTRSDVDKLLGVDGEFASTEAWRQIINRYAQYVRQNLKVLLGAVPIKTIATESRIVPADLQFVLRIVIPHWILRGRSLYDSLDEARRGDLEALDVLLRLDPSLVNDEQIAEYVHEANHNRGTALSDRISLALNGQPNRPTRKALKNLAFGVLSIMSDRVGVRLEAPDIRQLADALANVRSNGSVRLDHDLPDSPEALTKAIQRGRKDFMERVTVEQLRPLALPCLPTKEAGKQS